MNDLLIIGGGPAGVAAGVYAARKQLRTVLVAEEIGGQSTVSEGIENWIGTPKIPGAELAKAFRAHLDAVKNGFVDIREGERIEKREKAADGKTFLATTKKGEAIETRSVLITSGAARRRLDVPGADTFEHKGVTYCASCDGPIFGGQDVAVVGGGNAGFETALQLLAYANSVTLIHRRNDFKADAVTVQRAKEHHNMTVMTPYEPVSVEGEKFVSGLKVRNVETNEESTLSVTGVFVEIGVIPNSGFVNGLVELDAVGHIITNPRNQRTSVEGIWAAGDITDALYHQNNIAAGDAVKALEDLYLWLKTEGV